MPRFILVLLLVSTTPVRADPGTATAQLRARFEAEWRALADAPKAVDWRITYRGKRYAGDWMLTLGAYRYFIDRDKIRCQIQEDKYMTCDAGDSVEPRWTASTSRRVTLATMRMLHRAVFHDLEIILDDDRHGHALVETLVTSPDAEERTSQRYRANVTLTAESFAIGRPILVEEFRETCVAINGCHSTHWSCHRRE